MVMASVGLGVEWCSSESLGSFSWFTCFMGVTLNGLGDFSANLDPPPPLRGLLRGRGESGEVANNQLGMCLV